METSNLLIINMNNVKKMEFQLDVNQVIDFISIPKSGCNLKLKQSYKIIIIN
jgi:hypothetical protein